MNKENMKQLISKYYDGQCTKKESLQAEEFIETNLECKSYYDELTSLTNLLHNDTDEVLSADCERKIYKSLLGIAQKEKPMYVKPNLVKIGFGGGALVAVVLCVFVIQMYVKRGVQGRLKYAADDISTQAPTSTGQYEPYYLTTEYVSQTLENNVPLKQKLKPKTSQIHGTEGMVDMSARLDVNKLSKAKKENAHLSLTQEKQNRRQATGGKQMSAYYAPGTTAAFNKRVRSTNNFDYIRAQPRTVIVTSDQPSFLEHYHPVDKFEDEQREREEYEAIYENSFLLVQHNPLSTFGADVDTASYSNVRRFLKNGQLPPQDAVRVEEMINYFDYNYSQPTWGKPISITTDAALTPWNPDSYLVRVGIQAKTLKQNEIPPSNVVFLIDVSGSMNTPNKLSLLKNAFKTIASQLTANEKVAIVTYNGNARLLLNSTSGSNKQKIMNAIDNLRAGGGTAGSAGLQMAYNIAHQNFIKNGNNRIILASDGDFNVGVSNDYDLVNMIEQKRKEGVFLTVLGFGTGNLKDSKMEKIANHGNGSYHYLDSIRETEKVLKQELGSTLFTIAKDVKLQVEFNPSTVHSYRLLGYENRQLAHQDFNNDRVDSGDMGAGHNVTALYEVIPNEKVFFAQKGLPLKYQQKKQSIFANSDILTVKVRYKEPKSNQSKLIKKVIKESQVQQHLSGDFRFISSVAQFGLLLKNSQFKGYASYENALIHAQQSVGQDVNGNRREFIDLIRRAQSIDYRSLLHNNNSSNIEYEYPSNMQFKGGI